MDRSPINDRSASKQVGAILTALGLADSRYGGSVSRSGSRYEPQDTAALGGRTTLQQSSDGRPRSPASTQPPPDTSIHGARSSSQAAADYGASLRHYRYDATRGDAVGGALEGRQPSTSPPLGCALSTSPRNPTLSPQRSGEAVGVQRAIPVDSYLRDHRDPAHVPPPAPSAAHHQFQDTDGGKSFHKDNPALVQYLLDAQRETRRVEAKLRTELANTDSLQTQMSQLRVANANLEAQVHRSEEHVRELQGAVRDRAALVEERNELEERLKRIEDRLRAEEEDCKQLSSEHQKLRREHEAVVDDREELRRQLLELQKFSDEYRKRLREADDAVYSTKQDKDLLEQRVAMLMADRGKLDEANKRLEMDAEKRREVARYEHQQHERRIVEAQGAIEGLKRTEERLVIAVEAATLKHEQLQVEVAATKDKLIGMHDAVRDKDEQLGESRRENMLLRQQVTQLKQFYASDVLPFVETAQQYGLMSGSATTTPAKDSQKTPNGASPGRSGARCTVCAGMSGE